MERHQAETAMFVAVRSFERDPTGFRVEDSARQLPSPVREAIESGDVPFLIELGAHPCLVIVFAYAINVQRPTFIDRLPPVELSEEKPRWRS